MAELQIGKNRLEAFSDGVFAIIITIMVLELKVPHGDTFESLVTLYPIFLSYILSFVMVAIYWNNHHHMIHTCRHVTGSILWANMHLLFWLSLIPFTTAWMGENNFSSAPTFLYGVNLILSAVAYFTLQKLIIYHQGENSILKNAIGNDTKGKISTIIYFVGIISAFWKPAVAIILYSVVMLIWIVPDKRIEYYYKSKN